MCLNPEFDVWNWWNNSKRQKQQQDLGYVFSFMFRLPATEELVSQKGRITIHAHQLHTRTAYFCKQPLVIFTWKHRLWMNWTVLYNKYRNLVFVS